MGFGVGDIGYASAIGWMLFAIIAVLSILQWSLTWRREDAA